MWKRIDQVDKWNLLMIDWMERTFAEFRRSAKIKHGTFNGMEKRIRTNWKYTASHYVRGIEMIAKFVCLKAWTCWKRIKFQNHKVFLSTLRFVHFGLIFFCCLSLFLFVLILSIFFFAYIDHQSQTKLSIFFFAFANRVILFFLPSNSFKFIQAKWLVC